MDKNLYKNINFMIYLAGVFISGLGSKLTTVALADKVFALTGSGTGITLVYLFQCLPALFFGLIAGYLVDRSSKKAAFFLVNTVLAVFSLCLAFISNISVLFLLIFLIGIADAFYDPIATALMPLLVGKSDLAAANGLKISVIGGNMILGYALAGIFVSFFGQLLPFLVDCASYLIIAASSLCLTINERGDMSSKKKNNGISEALSFIIRQPVIRRLFLVDVLTQFIIVMQIPLTYIFVARYLGGENAMAGRTGLLFSAAGGGMMLGGLFLKRFSPNNKFGLLSRVLIFDSLFVTTFTLNRFFPLTIIIYGAMGVIGAFMGSLLETAIQENTPEHMIGRISGFIHSIADPISILSLLCGSTLIHLLDVQWIFLACAVAECLTGIYFTVKKAGASQIRFPKKPGDGETL